MASVALERSQISLRDVLAGRLRAVFQPIVELDGLGLVGYEALARGPVGSSLERPDLLFAAAREEELLVELDWACRMSAVDEARRGRIGAPLALFVNVEPAALGTGPADVEVSQAWQSAHDELKVVLEVTERALLERPAELLKDLESARERGCLIAIDDVGADPRSLALMPFLHPEIIKLDLRLVQVRPSREIAQIVNAVRAEAERSGAQILAEGIEHEEHLEQAHAFGATLGQGYMFGRPQPLDLARPGPGLSVRRTSAAATFRTPFELIGAAARTRVSRKPLLIEISKQLEAEAGEIGETATLVAAFQEARFFTEKTRQRYTDLGRRTAFVAAIAQGLPSTPAPGVRGIALDDDDPLVGEWTTAVVAPHFAACLSARDLGDDGPESQRRFEYVLTFDRARAIAAAESLLSRVTST